MPIVIHKAAQVHRLCLRMGCGEQLSLSERLSLEADGAGLRATQAQSNPKLAKVKKSQGSCE